MFASGLFWSLPALLLYTGTASAQYGWPSSLANEAYGPSWTQFANATQRWSTYAAPTFNEVFIPQTEEDLSAGVSSTRDILDILRELRTNRRACSSNICLARTKAGLSSQAAMGIL